MILRLFFLNAYALHVEQPAARNPSKAVSCTALSSQKQSFGEPFDFNDCTLLSTKALLFL
jgi:hypothetical protein